MKGAQQDDESTYNNILKKGLALRQAFCVN